MEYLAKEMLPKCLENRVVVSTPDNIFISSLADLELTRMSPCNDEEAYTCLFLHYLNAVKSEAKSAMIHTD